MNRFRKRNITRVVTTVDLQETVRIGERVVEINDNLLGDNLEKNQSVDFMIDIFQ